MNNKKNVRLPSLIESALPILTMVSLMIYVFVFAKDGEKIYMMQLTSHLFVE